MGARRNVPVGSTGLSTGVALALVVALGCATIPDASARSKKHHRAKDIAFTLRGAHVEPVSFDALPGWKDDDTAAAYSAFAISCRAILNSTASMRKGRPIYDGLFKACQHTKALGPLDATQARAFFEDQFKPVRIAQPGETQGFFTGYYETEVHGSLAKTDEFRIPIYAAPAATVRTKQSKVFAHLDRAAIENGALDGKGLEICWVKNPVDAFFAQIQGSTRVKLDDGGLLRLNYVASNGMRYTPVGRDLIDRGIISKEEMSMDRIRSWMDANPQEGELLRRKNKSFVFFQKTALAPHEECIGAQGVPLSPLRSIAVDRKIHTYGTPVWIDAALPIESEKPETVFRRLMIAQDTGSAIVGPARADIYFGAGEEVGLPAGRVKQFGNFVMLVPRAVAVKGDEPQAVPLPRPRASTMAQHSETPPAAQ